MNLRLVLFSPAPFTIPIESVVSQELSADIARILAHNFHSNRSHRNRAAGLTYAMSLAVLVVANAASERGRLPNGGKATQDAR